MRQQILCQASPFSQASSCSGLIVELLLQMVITVLPPSTECREKLWWFQNFNFSFLHVWQGLISILSMWSHPMFLMVELFDLCCWSMAGLAPSMSSTRSSLCSRSQPNMAWMRVMWCLRSSAPPSQDMASQRPLTRKVSNEKALLELQFLE